MKPNVIPLVAGLLLTVGIVHSASADAEDVRGVVSHVQPIYITQWQKTPIREQICRTEQVPIFSGRRASRHGGEELEGLIAGGLVGSAIGNAVSDKPGAGTAGAVVGALIGRQQAEDRHGYKPGSVIGYRQQQVCRNEVTRVLEESVEKLVGYELDVAVDGETISVKTDARHQYQSGDTIRLSRSTRYHEDDDDDDRRRYQHGYYDDDRDDDYYEYGDDDKYDRHHTGRSNGGLVGLTADITLGVFGVATDIAGSVIHMADLLLFGW